jgi:hypothetical protein
VAGKSKIELVHHAAAVDAFSGARSGAILRSEAFTHRRSWSADISLDVNQRKLVIEYDGAHWHKAPARSWSIHPKTPT